METASRTRAGRILHAAGLVDRVFVKQDGPWQGIAVTAVFLILMTGIFTGIFTKDSGFAAWTVRMLKFAIAGGGVVGIVVGVRAFWDSVYARWLDHIENAIGVERARVDLEAHRMRSKITILRPDEWGRRGVSFDGAVYRDLDTKAAFSQDINLALLPVMEQMHALLEGQRALARAIPPSSYHNEQVSGDQLLPDGQEVADRESRTLRTHVTLAELQRTYGRSNYHRMLIGETVNERGDYAPVWADMTDAVHLLISGATRWGKSTFLESLAKQLAVSGDADLCFVDIGVNTFGVLADYALYPIAETPGLVVALFQQLCQEMERRRQAMSQYPQVKNLEQYNRASGDDLRPIVCFVDEASVLFDRSGDARDLATDLTRMGRKYGIGCALGGTDFRAETLPTSARGNCGARFAFHFDEPGLSRSIIRSTAAVNLRYPGRALALLPGQPMIEVQCPIVERWDDLPKARGQVIELEAVEVKTPGGAVDLDAVDDPELPDADRVILLHDAGASDTAIAGRLWHPTTYYIQKVRGILADRVVVVVPDDDNTASDGGPVFVHDNNNSEGDE